MNPGLRLWTSPPSSPLNYGWPVSNPLHHILTLIDCTSWTLMMVAPKGERSAQDCESTTRRINWLGCMSSSLRTSNHGRYVVYSARA